VIKNINLQLPYSNNKVKNSITLDRYNTFKQTFKIAQILYFYFSKGKILLEFETHFIDSTIHEMYTKKYGNYQQNIIAMESITPYPSQLLFYNINSFDTLLVVFPSKKLPRSTTTSSIKIPYIPKELTAKVHREVIYIGDQRIIPHTVIHELFHVFEHTFRIRPAHLFNKSKESQWPDWYQGEGQLFYYQQQFINKILTKNLKKLLFRTKKRKITKDKFNKKMIKYLYP